MNGADHVALTAAVLDVLEYPGDHKLVAKNAYYPDLVLSIAVEGQGSHIFGRNLASLVHFTIPYAKIFRGYCWKRDDSLPHMDLGGRKVIPHPEAWGSPIIGELVYEEPFNQLVDDLKASHSCIEADDITYSTAAVMAGWVQFAYAATPPTLTADRDTLLGWALHLTAQDPCVPHHAMGWLLAGHSGFEGDMGELLNKWMKSGRLQKEIAKYKDQKPQYVRLRDLAEATAKRSTISLKRMELCRCFWRVGWNKLVRGALLRAIEASVHTVKALTVV